jgi:hypothetical protein
MLKTVITTLIGISFWSLAFSEPKLLKLNELQLSSSKAIAQVKQPTQQTNNNNISIETIAGVINNTLSALVALLSVSALTLPRIKKTFFKEKSNVKIKLIKVGEIVAFSTSSMSDGQTKIDSEMRYWLYLTLLITNAAEEPGVITSGEIILYSGAKVAATGDIMNGIKNPNVIPKCFNLTRILVPLDSQDNDLFPYSVQYSETDGFSHTVNISSGNIKIHAFQNDSTESNFTFSITSQVFHVRKLVEPPELI